jgi:K+ transporter
VAADLVDERKRGLERVARRTTPAAALAALGIVYGDLGTSPLYALQAWSEQPADIFPRRLRSAVYR